MTSPRVALVLVSHSRALAEGVAELAGQMAPDVVLAAAGGADDGRLGTGFDVVAGAIDRAVADGRSAVVLTDLGSALLTTESVIELADPEVATRVRLVDAPFVEGAVEAAVAAQGGGDLAQVAEAAEHAALSFAAPRRPGAQEAERAAGGGDEGSGDRSVGDAAAGRDDGAGAGGDDDGAGGDDHAGEPEAQEDPGSAHGDPGRPPTPAPAPLAPSAPFADAGEPGRAGAAGASGTAGSEVTARGTAVLRNRLGLHARPAAQLVRTAGAFRSTIEVNGVDARSVLALVGLGAVGGTQVVVTATGPDARTAVRALVAEIEDGFGEG